MGISFATFVNMKVCCVFLLESPNRLNYPKSAAMGFFHGTQERVRNGSGKRAISVRGTEGPLFI